MSPSTSRIVAIHQPQYLPWLPYFAKAAGADVFVYLDDVQFQKNGVQNRNQIKSAQGAQWLTVPVRASLELAIDRTPIDYTQSWRQKHVRSIRQAYARAPFLELVDQGLEEIIARDWPFLADLTVALTEWMFDRLEMDCERVRASTLGATGRKGELVLDICRRLGATVYLSGSGARSYQDERTFADAGIELRYPAYRNPEYGQCHGAFLPDMSALDLILNQGPGANGIMMSGFPADGAAP